MERDKAVVFRRYIGFCCLGLLGMAMLVAAMVAALDPYGESGHGPRGWKSLTANPLTAAQLMRRLSTGPHVLVFGTSRSRYLGHQVLGRAAINLHSVYGTPQAALDFLTHLDRTQLANISGVIYLLDGHTFHGDDNYDPVDYHDPVAAAWYRLRHANGYVREAWRKALLNLTGRTSYWIEPTGETWSASDQVFDGRMRVVEDRKVFTARSMALLSQVDGFLRGRAIPVTYVTPLLPDQYLAELDLNGWSAMLKAFAQALPDGFIDMTRVAGISDRTEFFYDSSHLNKAGTRRVFAEADRPGRRVDAANVDSHVERLRAEVLALPKAPRM